MKNRSFIRRVRHKLSRTSLKILIAWIRFSHRHSESPKLPLFLFLFLIADGFVMVIPSILLLIASITISPRRWGIFGIIFATAATLNNALVYLICRLVSPDEIVLFVERFHLEDFWQSAERALHTYGSWAAFIGAIIGLPTQMVLGLIGVADAQTLRADPTSHSTFVIAISFAFFGHLIKGIAIAGLSRFGWIRLEKKVQARASKI